MNRTNERARRTALAQGKRNNSERGALSSAIRETLPYAPRTVEFKNELTFRVDYFDGEKIFRAVKIRRSEHFPYIVPELVNRKGEHLLITWLTYGSLIRLLNELR